MQKETLVMHLYIFAVTNEETTETSIRIGRYHLKVSGTWQLHQITSMPFSKSAFLPSLYYCHYTAFKLLATDEITSKSPSSGRSVQWTAFCILVFPNLALSVLGRNFLANSCKRENDACNKPIPWFIYQAAHQSNKQLSCMSRNTPAGQFIITCQSLEHTELAPSHPL